MIIVAKDVMGKRLQFVVGKGGVGKSTVAAALAMRESATCTRVLALELGGARGLSRLFDCAERVSTDPIEARPGLFLATVDGESALAEYLELVVPIRRLLHTVFATRLYRYFVAAAPGLKELMTVGKIWYEFHKTRDDGSPHWDVIVVDAGASGHSLQYLQMPSTAASTFRSGLVHRESERVAALLRDAETTEVHVVATAEEMPITEACQIVARLRGELSIPVGRLFVNRCLREPPPGTTRLPDLLAKLSSPPAANDRSGPVPGWMAGVVSVCRRTLAWQRIQAVAIQRLEREIAVAPVRLPLLAAEEFGAAELTRLAEAVG